MGKTRIATVWLDGCSGCHMSFLDMDERLLAVAEKIDLVIAPATKTLDARIAAGETGRYDFAFIDAGSGPRINSWKVITRAGHPAAWQKNSVSVTFPSCEPPSSASSGGFCPRTTRRCTACRCP